MKDNSDTKINRNIVRRLKDPVKCVRLIFKFYSREVSLNIKNADDCGCQRLNKTHNDGNLDEHLYGLD